MNIDDTPALRWFAERGRWSRLGLSILCGASLTAGHPPIGLPWIFFATMPVIVMLLASVEHPRGAASVGWGVGFGYFVTGLHWIGHAFLVDPDKFLWLIPLGVAALPAMLALFWLLAFHLASRVSPASPVGLTLGLAICLTLTEYARSNILTGFPWALPAYIWVDHPPMQAAAWIGPFGLTFLTLLITAIPGLVVATGSRRPIALAAVTASLLASAGIWIAGDARVPEQVAYAADAPVVRIVQPNAPQHLKWQPGFREQFYDRALAATAEPPHVGFGPADVVIWPEAAVHFVPALNPIEAKRISDAASGAPVLLGAIHGEATSSGDRWSNAFVSILPGGEIGPRYDKHHLVPFGEYLPFQAFFDRLGISQFAIRGGFTRGPGPRTIKLDNLPSFSPLICYEAIFPNRIVSDERPDWLVQPTNDAWFGGGAGPQQHYAQARIRAIEQGLPMVRAANTGISAIVSPHGLEVVSLNLHNYGSIDGRLPSPLERTLYSRTGDLPSLLVVVFLLFLSIFYRPNHIGR